MERLQKVISVMEMDIDINEAKLIDKNSEMEELRIEKNNLETALLEANIREKKYLIENKNLNAVVEHYENERTAFMEKYNSYSDELQKVGVYYKIILYYCIIYIFLICC